MCEPDRQRTDGQVSAELARHLAEGGERRVGVLFHDVGKKPLTPGLQQVGHLRRLHIIGSGRSGFASQEHGRVHVRRGRAPGAPLDYRRLEGRHTAALSLVSNASRLPARSSACRSSLPPTCTSPMKICGTVILPFARSIISSLRSQSRSISISVNSTPFRFSNALAEWQ